VRLLIIIILLIAVPAYATTIPSDFLETRYTTKVVRDKSGHIKRSMAVRRAFRKIHPCPATMETTGRCLGWQVDHTIPLACGGRDAVSNMQWLPVHIKTCAGLFCKDRFERKIYDIGLPDTGACVNRRVK